MSNDYDVFVGPVAVPDTNYVSWHLFAEDVFVESDIHHRSRSATHPLVRSVIESLNEEKQPQFDYFLASAQVVRKRLLIQGYTSEFCRNAWQKAHRESIDDLQRLGERFEHVATEIRELETITFESWFASIAEEVDQFPQGHQSRRRWGFEDRLSKINDIMVQLALLLDALPRQPVWMDCGFLYEGDEARTPQQMSRDEEGDYADYAAGSIIVLTEGKSDTRLISAALKAFYPEFFDIYQFLDFDEFSIEGGATALAKMIKILSGARVKNRMIALFDNDAAGVEAHRSLGKVKFPNNVRLMRLPDIKLANRYPTLGPAGPARMNINGLGAPIELYLGRDSLKDSEGKLRPVRWAHWVKSVKGYQAVVEDKDSVATTFMAALNSSKSPAALRHSFPEMDILLKAIFAVFEDHQPPMF